MQSKLQITATMVDHIATLSHIPVSESEAKELATGFTKVMEVVDRLSTVDTAHTEPVGQVTGLQTVLRDDVIDETHLFTQEGALRNAPRTHNGYFVVDQILDK